jgi:serine/threonine protein kinase
METENYNKSALQNLSKKQKLFKNYLLLGQIGQGKYSKVKRAIDLEKGTICAVKLIRENITSYNLENLFNEINIMIKLNHPNIVKIIDFIQDADYPKSSH